MRQQLIAIMLIGIVGWTSTVSVAEATRIKDVATVEGIRENPLIGYGLVVGLDRTGDQVIGGQFTIQSLMSMLNKMGINLVIDPILLLTRNVASVMVTGKLLPFAKPGQSMDVTVSSIANARSLQGGTLLLTPLKGANQQVYAVAQGPVSIGGFLAGSTTPIKNHPVAGRIPNGATVEKEVPLEIENWTTLSVLLRRPDFTTATRLSDTVNKQFGPGVATPVNAGLIKVALAEEFKGKVVEFLSLVESLEFESDSAARVVVNEKTGTVVLGEHVRLTTCAISHGNLIITIKTTSPAPFAAPSAPPPSPTGPEAEVKEDVSRVVQMDQTVTLGEVVKALNTLGVTPRDLVAILSAMKSAGALEADLEII